MRNLQVQNINLAFGEKEILKDVSFNMNERTRAAIAGSNGCGKSTLLKSITSYIEADSINLTLTKGSRVSYLPQTDILLPNIDIYTIAEEGYKRFETLLLELDECGKRAQEEDEKEALNASMRISEIHDILLDSGYYDRKNRIETILLGLGFKNSDFSRKANEFSGGYQMRVALARILVENPDFLLLDEPTNYLDIEALTWLKNYIKGFNGGLMIVSHDQDFLDSIVNEVYELFNGKLTRYSGNYTKYLETREIEIQQKEKERKRQEEKIEKTEAFIERFRYKATKAKQVQSRIKTIEKTELVEIPGHLKKLKFSFPPSPHSPNIVLTVENLTKAYGTNTIYSNFSFIVNKGERIAITGRNGEGKSTLLRILAGIDSSYTGLVESGNGIVKGYFAQDTENTLDGENDLVEELETVSTTDDIPRLRNMLGSFLFSDDDVFKKVKVLSGGERSRLALLKILLHPSNLLLLDEPTNHLDINSKEMLLEAIKKYEGTVIFVSHDKHFIKNLATRILYISDEKPIFFNGDYDYFESKIEEKEKQWEIKKAKKETDEKPNTTTPSSFAQQKARRNKIKSLEKEIERISSEIEKLEEIIEEKNEESGRSEIYSDPSKIKKVMEEKKKAEEEKEEKENLWLEKSEELDRLNKNE